MSLGRKSLEYAAAAVIVSLAIIAASVLYMGLPIPNQNSSSAQGGQSSVLAIRLTDPPQVPHLTSSLNLTYTSLSLLVGEPTGTAGQLTTKSVSVTPSGGTATVDLLRLQNISQTIALASLPSGSVLYSVTFTMPANGIKIDVNDTISSVALATGGSTFTVTIARPSAFSSGDFALLQLNPVVVNTPSGYQLIPSSVGVMGHGGEGAEEVGSHHQLSGGDNDNLSKAHGNVTASMVALSVKGNVTTLTIRINNTGTTPVDLNALGVHGNFTVMGNICQTFRYEVPYMQGMSGGYSRNDMMHGDSAHPRCMIPMHMDEVVFVPVAPSTSTTATSSTSSSTHTASAACIAGQMSLVNGMDDGDQRGLTLQAGKCVQLTFTGQISFGRASFDLVPSTSAGQVYVLHVIASNGANELVSCTLPLGANSCKAIQPQPDSRDW